MNSAGPGTNSSVPSSRPSDARSPLPSYQQTSERLAKVPLEALSTAAGRVLGDRNKASLLLAAAACANGGETERCARGAVQALLQPHKERLLNAANQVLREMGEPQI